MKVFHIITRLDVGGAERVAINIASSQSDVEHHIVEVLRGHSPFTSGIIQELDRKSIPYHRAWLPVMFHWHYLCEKALALLFSVRLMLLYLRYRPDVIHSHTEIPDMAVWCTNLLFPLVRARIVRTIHNTKLWSGMTFTGTRVERFMQRHGANIAISPNVAEAYHAAYGQLPPVIYNGVCPTEQVPYSGIVQGRVNICFAGRLEEQKGIRVLCGIIRMMKDDPRYYFHIFGSGTLQPIVDELRTFSNVSVAPPLHGISSYLSSFDYLIMPSLHEGLSILALEASFNGLPLMINRCAGLEDTLPPDWPLAVDGNSMDQWEQIFRNLLPDIDRTALVRSAYDFVSCRFSLRQMQDQYEKFYTQQVAISDGK